MSHVRLSGPLTRHEMMDRLDWIRRFIHDRRGLKTDDALLSFELDLSEVAPVDTSALALIIALEREAREMGVRLVWRNPSSSLLALARLSSVDFLFEPAA